MNQSPDASFTPSPPSSPNRRRWLTVLAVLAFVAIVAWLARVWHQQQAPARFERALLALERNDMAALRRELNGWPNSPAYAAHRHFLTGALLLREGKPQLALGELDRAAQRGDLQVRARTLAGAALYQLGQPVDAVGVLERAIELDDAAVDAHRWLGSCYYDLGVNQLALRHLRRVAELDERDPRPHRLIGLMHKDFEHYSDAVAAYRESMRRSESQPDIDELRIELAECLVKLRQYPEASELLAKLNSTPITRVLQAECFRATGDSTAALELVDSALRDEPRNLKALSLKGTHYLEDGDPAEAVTWFAQAVAAHPHDYPARFKYSQALQRAGQAAEAAEQTKLANQTKQLYERFTAQHEQADREPNNAAIRYELGETALQLGRPDLAENWFRMTLALDPRHRDAMRELEQLHRAGSSSSTGDRSK